MKTGRFVKVFTRWVLSALNTINWPVPVRLTVCGLLAKLMRAGDGPAAVATLAAQTVRPTANKPYRTRIEARSNMNRGSDFKMKLLPSGRITDKTLTEGSGSGVQTWGGQAAVAWPPAVMT